MNIKRKALLFMLILIFFVKYLSAADIVKVKSILNDPNQFNNEIVGIIGIVSQLQDEKDADRGYYFLKDSWGDRIKIVTENDLPVLDNLYEIKGAVILGDIKEKTNEKEIRILEMFRRKITNLSQKESPIIDWQNRNMKNIKQDMNSSNDSNKKLPLPWWSYFLTFGNTALLILIFAIFYYQKKTTSNSDFSDTIDTRPSEYIDSTPFPGSIDTGPSIYPEPAEYIEDAAIKMSTPPEGTLKILPGWLEMISGYDKVKDIRLYKCSAQEETEVTFGRSTGAPYVHIQFKSPTVSSKQAKLIWANGKYLLLNYSSTNPTKVDDIELKKDQAVAIGEGNKIEMGEVVFIFHIN